MNLFYKIKVVGFEINLLLILAFSNVLFISLYLFISYFNRIATDDFYFLNSVNNYGIIEGTIHEHITWSGRWTSVLLTHTVLFFHKSAYSLFIYQVSVVCLFAISVYRLIKNITYLLGQVSFKKGALINFSILIISALFYSCFKIDETWFWLCASSNYLLSTVFFILGISAIINPNKTILNTTFLVLSFTYLGGSCEPLALFSIFILLLFILGVYLKRIIIPLQSSLLISRTFTAILFCIGSFIILYIANGNRIREIFFEDISIFECFFLNFKTTGMILLLRLPAIIPYLILFSLPAFYLGILQNTTNKSIKTIIKRIFIVGLIYGFLIYMYQFPVTYVTQDIAAYRALFPITLLTFISSLFVFYYLGLLIKIRKSLSQYVLFSCLICIILLTTYTLYKQYNVLPKYAKLYDERIELLLKNKNNLTTNELKPLPNSGLLFSAEISTDPQHFTNQHLQMGLNLTAKVKLKYPEKFHVNNLR